jgi:hypothetical protein
VAPHLPIGPCLHKGLGGRYLFLHFCHLFTSFFQILGTICRRTLGPPDRSLDQSLISMSSI